eukprot:2796679-Amphidinium_carterae.1
MPPHIDRTHTDTEDAESSLTWLEMTTMSVSMRSVRSVVHTTLEPALQWWHQDASVATLLLVT